MHIAAFLFVPVAADRSFYFAGPNRMQSDAFRIVTLKFIRVTIDKRLLFGYAPKMPENVRIFSENGL